MTINSFGVNCPGCGVELTVENAGGYRCFCQTCVDVMPPLPEVTSSTNNTGFVIQGQYPNFSWVDAGKVGE